MSSREQKSWEKSLRHPPKQVNRIASWLTQKTVAEAAKLAAQGNAEAKTAIKIIKDAARLAEK